MGAGMNRQRGMRRSVGRISRFGILLSVGVYFCAGELPLMQNASMVVSPACAADLPIAESVILKKDNGKGGAGDTVQAFLPSEKTFHFVVKSSQMLKGAHVRWVFTALNTSAGRGMKVFDEQGLFTGNMLTAELSNQNPWPIGKYQGEVYVEDQAWKNFVFEVKPERALKEKVEVLSLTLSKDENGNKPPEPLKVFKSTDHQMHFTATTKGTRSDPVHVKWVLTAVDTSEGKGLKVAEFELPDVYIASSVLTSKFSLPGQWPVGEYEVTLFVENDLAQKFSFRVEQ